MSTGPWGFPVTHVRNLYHAGMTRAVTRAIHPPLSHLPDSAQGGVRWIHSFCPCQDPVVQDYRNGCGEGEVLPLQTERYQTARIHSSTYNSKAPRTALGFGGLLVSHKQRDTCLPGLSCTLPGKSLDCWSHFCGRAQAGPLSEPWHSSLNLDVSSQVWLGCKQTLCQKIGEDAFRHLQIQRRIAKNLCSKRKKKLFKGHISSTGTWSLQRRSQGTEHSSGRGHRSHICQECQC